MVWQMTPQWIADPIAVENIRSYAANRNTLIVSDWAGDIIEAAGLRQLDLWRAM